MTRQLGMQWDLADSQFLELSLLHHKANYFKQYVAPNENNLK